MGFWGKITGITKARRKVATATGIPTTSSGRRRKFGSWFSWRSSAAKEGEAVAHDCLVGCLFLVGAPVVLFIGCGILGVFDGGTGRDRRAVTESPPRTKAKEASPDTKPLSPNHVGARDLEKSYYQLAEGMSYREVVEIIGREGRIQSGFRSWFFPDDGALLVQFEGDRLVDKGTIFLDRSRPNLALKPSSTRPAGEYAFEPDNDSSPLAEPKPRPKQAPKVEPKAEPKVESKPVPKLPSPVKVELVKAELAAGILTAAVGGSQVGTKTPGGPIQPAGCDSKSNIVIGRRCDYHGGDFIVPHAGGGRKISDAP